MKREDYELILGALEVGLPDDGERDIQFDQPHVFEGLHAPTVVRAIVTIDGQPYEVVIRGLVS